MLSVSQWKASNRFIQRRLLIEQKVKTSTSVDTKTSPAFYSMIAKTKSSLFNWNTSCRIPTGAPVLACMINVLHNMLFKTKIEQLKTVVLFENIGGNISCECDTEMMSPFRLDTIYSTIIFPLYVTIFWLKIA